MIKLIKQIVIVTFSAILLNSCGGEDSHVISDGQTLVSFSPRVDNASTKAEAISSDSLKSFGVYASVNSTAPYLLMENEYIYKTESNNWIYDQIKYWPLNESVNFFAYSPYGNNNISVSYPDKNLTCITPDDPDDQFDLMAVEVTDKRAIDGPVALLFKHLLSRIDFVVSAVDTQENYDITLNAFELVINQNTISNSGIYNMADETWQIDDQSFMSGDNYKLIKTPATVSDKKWEYSMMMLPQEHNTGDMTVNISYSILSDDSLIATKEASIPLSRIVCEKGKKYTYNFEITLVGMRLEIGVLPWNTDGWGSEVYPDNP